LADAVIRWGDLRLFSGDPRDGSVSTDAMIEIDDIQLWFRRNPERPAFRQIVINLSGAQWEAIKELPIVSERNPKEEDLG
jgi:hypothetical protein